MNTVFFCIHQLKLYQKGRTIATVFDAIVLPFLQAVLLQLPLVMTGTSVILLGNWHTAPWQRYAAAKPGRNARQTGGDDSDLSGS
jgi:hypothetical protein